MLLNIEKSIFRSSPTLNFECCDFSPVSKITLRRIRAHKTEPLEFGKINHGHFIFPQLFPGWQMSPVDFDFDSQVRMSCAHIYWEMKAAAAAAFF